MVLMWSDKVEIWWVCFDFVITESWVEISHEREDLVRFGLIWFGFDELREMRSNKVMIWWAWSDFVVLILSKDRQDFVMQGEDLVGAGPS